MPRISKSTKRPSSTRGQHSFAQVPKAEIPRSRFDRSFAHKTTLDSGLLIPVYLDEALPGDTFNVRMHAFARMATPLKPLMDNLYLDSFFFAVPNRLVWNNWQKFCGEQDNPGDSTDFTIPVFNPADFTGGSRHDYFGIPVGTGATLSNISCLHDRAYRLIWNEWFRDQNLENSISIQLGDGPDSIGGNASCLTRGKRHDYFTSCLPWPQKGEAVTLPLGTTADVFGAGAVDDYVSVKSSIDSSNRILTVPGPTVPDAVEMGADAFTATNRLYADLSSATAATINDLRQAFQLQKLLERDARGGTRYTEIVKSHFGVTSPDARLQRPEYLGGGSSPVVINPVAQTSSTDATTPQGNLSAVGTVNVFNHGFTKSFTEHCIIIGMVCVRADLTYQQGLPRMFSRSTRYDFYWPALAHIGEQAVLSKEIYMDGTANDEDVFGYQERYAEYRYKPSMITGQFRSNHTTPLDMWHLSQEFSVRPTLDSNFIVEKPPIDRVIAVPSEPDFLFDSFFKITCARPMPVYGVPGYIDHF